MWIRQCIHLNVKAVLIIVVTVVMNGVLNSSTAQNSMPQSSKPEQTKNNTNNNNEFLTIVNQQQHHPIDFSMCPSELACSHQPAACIVCTFNHSCVYGRELQVSCEARKPVACVGVREFQRSMLCRYCWQTELWEHSCTPKDNCNSAQQLYIANCTVQPDLLCLGKRNFHKQQRCNWTQGYKWSTALIISVTLGGFGADRFYLGHWQEGIGKLFSFGGLGVWTLIDVILISLHYLGPADGSLYL